MENLVYIIKLLKKYNASYFLKKALCKNTTRKMMALFVVSAVIMLLIGYILKSNFYILGLAMVILFASMFFTFKLIDKDHHEWFINTPLTMKFLEINYLALQLQAIKETLQENNSYSEKFLTTVIEECDTFLIIEHNGSLSILKNPFINVLIPIFTGYVLNILVEAKEYSHFIICFLVLLIYMAIVLGQFLGQRYNQVRTAKFIMETLKNHLRNLSPRDAIPTVIN